MLGQVLQLAGSIAAVLLLGLLCSKLRLGADVRIGSEAEARQLARDALCGFEPIDLALDRAGIGALLRDGQGRVMLLRRHGAHFAARELDSHAFARLDRNFLTLGTSESQFGRVTLDLGEKAQSWASSLRHLGGSASA
ncbi:MAG: hypothetical protein ABL914_08180 [Novosphingobium sp.]|uniref:hypothetical protein n=1 Tax=Novosphingobium sp. TaxID=1874826 RepID=UPI0032B96264